MENTQDKALQALREGWKLVIEGDGGHCPCCDRWGKIYRRPLNSSMARALMWLINQKGREDGWVHVPSIAPAWLLRSHQLPTLHLWGLVMSFGADTKLASSGLWQATPAGVAFAREQQRVPKYVYVYNNTALEFDGEQISIRDALGNKYNYDEIMANYDGTESSWTDKEDRDYDGYDA